MRIANNIQSLNVLNRQKTNRNGTSKAMEKLSSGLRINKAADDAAGLSISQKMRAQIRGLNQASRNAQDGISLIQTAEGALGEMEEITQRMRELCVQGTNGTLTDEDRNQIQAELDELKSEMTNISRSIKFNERNLLDGSLHGPIEIEETQIIQVKDTITETITETIRETVVETERIIETEVTYETVTELQEQTVTSKVYENISTDLDLDLSTLGSTKTAVIDIGGDSIDINLERVDNDTIQVSFDEDSNVFAVGEHSSSTTTTSLGSGLYGGNQLDGFAKVIQTSDGGYATVGYSAAANGDITSNSGGRDIWVMKFDSNFEKEWSYSAGTTDSENGFDLIELQGGHIGVVGYTPGDTLWNGDSYASVIKNDGSGVLWKRSVGGLKDDLIHSIEIASDGNLLLIGSSRSGEGDLTNGDHPQYLSCVVKVDKNTGTLLDSNFIYQPGSTTTFNHINDTIPLGSGDFLGVGQFGSNQMLIAFDEEGNRSWSKTYETGGLYKTDVMSDGSIVALGDYYDGSSYSRKLYCYESDGTLKWEKVLGGGYYEETDTIDSFTVNASDEIIMYYQDGFGYDRLTVDKNGNEISSGHVSSTQEIHSVIEDDDGNIIYAGEWNGQGMISGYAPAGVFPSEYDIEEDFTSFAGNKRIESGTVYFDSTSSSVKATHVDLKIYHFETSTQMVPVEVINEIITETEVEVEFEKEIEKQIEKEIEKDIIKQIEVKNVIVDDGSLQLQVGANTSQTMDVSIDDMRPKALGFIDPLPCVNPIEMAGVSITLSDDAINKISAQRSKLGAKQNALEHLIKNVDNAAEQLQAAESRIADVDMAKEMMLLSKHNIINEATNAMLAQSNQIPQGILQLLR
jgi:flagellin